MQEARRLDHLDLEVLEVSVINHVHHAGFLGIDQEFRTVVRTDDGGDARFRVILVGVRGHATGTHHLERLQRIAIHDRVLRRPVGAGNRVTVFVTLVLRGFDRARFQANLDLGYRRRFLHPQVDQHNLGVAADDVEVTTRFRNTRNVHCIASVDDIKNFLAGAIDQRNLASVTQRHRKEVGQVDVVHLGLRTLRRGNKQLPRRIHFLQAIFRRCRRFMLHIARHDVHFLLGQSAGTTPVRHALR